MQRMKVYQAFAQAIEARNNCKRGGNVEWVETWAERIKTLESELPSGSGFDNGTRLDDSSTKDRLVFSTSFHHMNEDGYYCGWSHHTAAVTPSLAHGIDVRITGRNVRDVKDYIGDIFDDAMAREIEW